jgi:dimeric dUTPase (all-alpha-NTP-PPase superfamily)
MLMTTTSHSNLLNETDIETNIRRLHREINIETRRKAVLSGAKGRGISSLLVTKELETSERTLRELKEELTGWVRKREIKHSDELDLTELYVMQRVLDARISAHGLPTNLFDLKVIAYKTELGELANELSFFKYWKQNHVVDDEKVLEEYVDGIHFLLSIGLTRQWDIRFERVGTEYWGETLDTLFIEIFDSPFCSCGEFKKVFSKFYAIGHLLGYTNEIIIDAYKRKNRKNHQRQVDGY